MVGAEPGCDSMGEALRQGKSLPGGFSLENTRLSMPQIQHLLPGGCSVGSCAFLEGSALLASGVPSAHPDVFLVRTACPAWCDREGRVPESPPVVSVLRESHQGGRGKRVYPCGTRDAIGKLRGMFSLQGLPAPGEAHYHVLYTRGGGESPSLCLSQMFKLKQSVFSATLGCFPR